MLEQIIGKENEKNLLQEYWEKKPMILKQVDPKGFSHILTKDNIDEIISSWNLENLDISIIGKDDFDMFKNLSPSERQDELAYRFALKDLFSHYHHGYPLHINNLYNNWYPLTKLSRSIEMALHPTDLSNSVILIPKGAETFALSFPNESLILLNISGTAKVKFYQERNEKNDEITSESGDFIYAPPSFTFEFTAESHSPSIFVLINYKTFTYDNFIQSFLSTVAEVEENFLLRSSLPVEFLRSGEIPKEGSKEKEKFHQAIKELQNILSKPENLRIVKAQLEKTFAKSSQPAFKGQLHVIHDSKHASLDSVIQRNEDIECYFEKGDYGLECYYYGDILLFPVHWEEGIQKVLDGEEIQIKNIPGALTPDEKLTLARETSRHGMTKIVHHKVTKKTSEAVLS